VRLRTAIGRAAAAPSECITAAKRAAGLTTSRSRYQLVIIV
jgi:hypothetical protein